MKQNLFKIISLIMTVALIVGTCIFSSIPTSAAAGDDIKSEIERLEKESKALQAEINKLNNSKKDQQKLKSAIESKMAVVQKQIDACNNQIASINKMIDENKAEIEANNKKIEKDKDMFKRRLRAIQMSNTGSNIQILLGANSFSEFLQLSQLTASVSARDKKLMEDIIAEIKVLNKKLEDNNKLLEEQAAVKATIAEKQKELKSQADAIQKVINEINKNKNDIQSDKNQIDKELQQKENELNQILYGSSGGNLVNDGKFKWPTSFKRISSYFGSRWGSFHKGVDISDGTYGKPVYAMADGEVYICKKSCTHNYRKVNSSGNVYSCGCGGGYGNYVAIDHGYYQNNPLVKIKAYYAHMGSVTVSNGAKVKKGQIIGYIGSTGRSTGPHLHFGVIKSTRPNKTSNSWTDTWVDPMQFF